MRRHHHGPGENLTGAARAQARPFRAEIASPVSQPRYTVEVSGPSENQANAAEQQVVVDVEVRSNAAGQAAAGRGGTPHGSEVEETELSGPVKRQAPVGAGVNNSFLAGISVLQGREHVNGRRKWAVPWPKCQAA